MKTTVRKKLCSAEKREMLNLLVEPLRKRMAQLLLSDWQIHVTSQQRGFCRYTTKEINIPYWAIQRGKDYANWYVAHEFAHAFCFLAGHVNEQHGSVFMEYLKDLCPAESLHFETSYKPRSAKAAGISKNASINKIRSLSKKTNLVEEWDLPEDF